MLALEARGLHKIYRGLLERTGTTALAGVDLDVARGSAFGLIGLNGAGKTTFIKTLLGVVHPSAGSVTVLGGAPQDPAVRRRIGYLPERLHLPHALTPRAFLGSVARLKRCKGIDAGSLLSRVGLGRDSERKIGGFSKGMRQRLGLAAALLGEPELLVLDEPTDGVDPLGRVDIRRILGEELERGATVLLNSHLLAETERVCSSVGILHKGRIVRRGTLEELCGSSSKYRARFAPGADARALSEIGFSPVEATESGWYSCEAPDPTALDALLVRARAAGALLAELGPEERSLEEVLSESIGPVSGGAR